MRLTGQRTQQQVKFDLPDDENNRLQQQMTSDKKKSLCFHAASSLVPCREAGPQEHHLWSPLTPNMKADGDNGSTDFIKKGAEIAVPQTCDPPPPPLCDPAPSQVESVVKNVSLISFTFVSLVCRLSLLKTSFLF